MPKNKLCDCLEQYTKDDLTFFAKKLGVGRISNLKKAEIAKRIADFMLNPEIMKRRLSILTDTQIALFERAIQHPVHPTEDELDDACTINEMDYGILTINDVLVVPMDVQETYVTINTLEFQEYRKRTSWLIKCLDVHNAFYGIAPVDILYKVYQNRPKYKIGKEAMLDLFHKIPVDLNDSYLVGDYILHETYYEEASIKKLADMQRDKEFYIPNYHEVEDYAKHLYLSEEASYQQLRSFFLKNCRMSFECAEDCTLEVWQAVTRGDGMGDMVNWLTEKRGVVFNSDKELRLFINALQTAYNNTRILANRGFKPSELVNLREDFAKGIYPTIVPGSSHAAELLKEAMPKIKAMGFSVDIDAGAVSMPVIHYPNGINHEANVTSKKIYPNDLCPCGSGKKYKKCCGR